MKVRLKENINLEDLSEHHWEGCQLSTMQFLTDVYSLHKGEILEAEYINGNRYSIQYYGNDYLVNAKCFEKVEEEIASIVRGYKGFNSNLSCRGFQYKVGEEYETNESIELCNSGFHFCRKLWDVNDYYSFLNDSNRFCEVEALGEIIDGGDKSVTSKIRIVKEFSKNELKELLNIGHKNTGMFNTGDKNTGYGNTGDRNTGDKNTGYWNTGYGNTGDRNTGDFNLGDYNSGDWNKGNHLSGVFCNKEQPLMMFNKKSDMLYDEWVNTRVFDLLYMIKFKRWISYNDMTDVEKKEHPSAEVVGGYYKEIPRSEATTEWWNRLSKIDKKEIFTLPNFNLSIFNDIMELEVSKQEYKEIVESE